MKDQLQGLVILIMTEQLGTVVIPIISAVATMIILLIIIIGPTLLQTCL